MAQTPGPQVDAGVEIDAVAELIVGPAQLTVIKIGVVADEGRIDPLYPLLRPDIVTPDPADIGLRQAERPAQAGQIQAEASTRHQGFDPDAVTLHLQLDRRLIGQLVDKQPPLRYLTGCEAKQRGLGIGAGPHLHLLAQLVLAIDDDVELIEAKGHEVGTGEARQIDVHPQAVEQLTVELDIGRRGGRLGDGGRRHLTGLGPSEPEIEQRKQPATNRPPDSSPRGAGTRH
ncbi:hypothetical protein D3C84_421410 [compost metagenome]